MDRTDNDTTTTSPEAPELEAAGEAERTPSFNFKLRLGSRESTAALAERGTGELVQLQPIDWESLTGLTTDHDHREYQTDSELQSIIVELANQIATPEELEREARRQHDEVTAAAEAAAETEAAAAAAPSVKAIIPTIPPPPPAPHAALAAPVAPTAPSVPPPPPAHLSAPVAPAAPDTGVPQIVEQTQNPSTQSPALAVGAAPVVGESEAPIAEPAPPAAPVMTSNAEAMQAAAATPALQLAKIERRPDMARPTKPVDFHALLGQAGLQPATVKKRKKRHPFRVLFKLTLVLAMLGTGAYFGKKYVLDKRWDGATKSFAEDVASESGLAWKKSVDVVDLHMKDYAPKLVASVLGPDADAGDLASQWRATGLIEGEVDFQAIGYAAAPFRPVFYDPADGIIYSLSGIAKGVHELFLDDALAHALLDQHVGWSDRLAELSPSEQMGLRALIDGDARNVALAIVDPSPSKLEDMQTEMSDIQADQAGVIGATRGYPVDLVIGAGAATSQLFAPDVFPDAETRTTLLSEGVASDAAVFDAARGVNDEPISLGTDSDVAGMMYWYYVLSSRLDDVTAWNAATAWNGDLTAFQALTIGKCVSSTISTRDEASRVQLLDALTQWAAAGPVESQTTVVPQGTERIEFVSCDPGVTADTMPDGAPTPWGFAASELDAVSTLDTTHDRDQRTCVVNAIRAYGVHQLELSEDPSAPTVVHDIQTACATG